MTRFQKKADVLLWFIISILPFILYFIVSFRQSTVVDFTTFMSNFRFDFIYDMFNQIFVDDLIFSDVLVAVISYLTSVEIIHIFYDFAVFLPRFCHNFLGRCYPHEK